MSPISKIVTLGVLLFIAGYCLESMATHPAMALVLLPLFLIVMLPLLFLIFYVIQR